MYSLVGFDLKGGVKRYKRVKFGREFKVWRLVRGDVWERRGVRIIFYFLVWMIGRVIILLSIR